MDKSIDEKIAELIRETNACQVKVRDESLDQAERNAARIKIQDNWYLISDLRKKKKKEEQETTEGGETSGF